MDILIVTGSILITIMLVIFFFQLHARLKGAPLVRSHQDTIRKCGELLALKNTDIIYDLGCGDGRVLFAFEKAYGCQGIGIDQSMTLIFWNHLRAFFKKSRVQFERKNLKTWLPTKDGKYYLFMMPKLFPHMDHIFDAMPPGTRVLCNTFPITRPEFTLLKKDPDDGFQKGQWLFLFEKR